MGIFFDIENIEESFFNFNKKSSNKSEITNIKLANDDEKKIAKEIHTALFNIVKKYNLDKKRTRKCLDDAIKRAKAEGMTSSDIKEEYGRFSGTAIPKLYCKIQNIHEGEIEFIICDEGQYVREAIWDNIICNIASDFKKNELYKLCKKVNLGDGDEGCIWVAIDSKAAKEYLDSKKQIKRRIE